MGKEIILSANDLCIGYPDKKGNTAVHEHLNFSLRKGELCSLIGPNGVGKSTLLRTISRLQPKLNGELTLCGKELETFSTKECSRKISVVLTDKSPIGGLTVSEVVALGRQPYTGFFGRLSENDDAMIQSAIQSVGMAEKANHHMAELSDGERQKAMIAKALVQESPIILLDEPSAFLDAASRIEVTQLLHDIAHTQGKAILFSTHDLEQALQLSDQLWLLTGNGLCCGAPEDLVLNHHLNSLFEGKNVFFDKNNGTFKHTNIYHKTAHLTASNELLLHWGLNAINRLNIGQAPSEQASTSIEIVSETKILLQKAGEEKKELKSFQALAEEL